MCKEAPRIIDRFTGAFGADQRAFIEKPFDFLAIGPESEWDACLVEAPGIAGELVLSKDAPLVGRFDRKARLKPFRTSVDASLPTALQSKLDVLAYDGVPPLWKGTRPPRLYSRASTTVSNVELTIRNVPVMGAKAFSLYLENADSSVGISWRLVGLKYISGGNVDEYPISPSTYADSAPTYNTLAADSHQAYHLDVDVDRMDWVRLYAVRVSTDVVFRDRWEVND